MKRHKDIDNLLDLLKEIWLHNPELRFNQLMYNLQSEYSQANEDIGEIKIVEQNGLNRVAYDLFYVNDDEFMDYLRNKV